jgi:hypothetical protein
LGIAGKVLGIAGKILGIAGKSSVRIANGGRVWRGLNPGPRVRPPAGLVPDSGLIKRCASTEVAGIDPAVGAFQVVHDFEPACRSCRCALA